MSCAPANDVSTNTTTEVIRSARAAVILNANAKRVTPRICRQAREVDAQADVFITESLEQAEFLIRRVVESGYGTVVTGGGDGTVAMTISEVLKNCKQLGRVVPRFGILRLGTGNGVADYLGAGDFRSDLGQVAYAPTRKMGILRVQDRACTFAGFGWDAHILDSYQNMKAMAEKVPVASSVFQTAFGYIIAALGKSIPQLIVQQPRWNVRVRNTGGEGYLVNSKGEHYATIAPGAVAYEGGVRICTFGTTPYFGYKFKIMPYAGTVERRFHMRLVDFNPLYAVGHLPTIWRSGYVDHPGCTDILLENCEIEILDGEAPLEIAGDAAGHHKQFTVTYDCDIDCLEFSRL